MREPHEKYTGETRFPLIMQNLHRYFFYVAESHRDPQHLGRGAGLPRHGRRVGFGLGTLIMVVNVVLLWGYTLSCHSCRHIIGGRLKHFSKHPVRYWVWTQVSKLNKRHMQFAWTTLGTLMLTDLYIMLVSAGVFSDLRFFN